MEEQKDIKINSDATNPLNSSESNQISKTRKSQVKFLIILIVFIIFLGLMLFLFLKQKSSDTAKLEAKLNPIRNEFNNMLEKRSSTDFEKETVNWKSYTNAIYGYTVKVPQDYTGNQNYPSNQDPDYITVGNGSESFNVDVSPKHSYREFNTGKIGEVNYNNQLWNVYFWSGRGSCLDCSIVPPTEYDIDYVTERANYIYIISQVTYSKESLINPIQNEIVSTFKFINQNQTVNSNFPFFYKKFVWSSAEDHTFSLPNPSLSGKSKTVAGYRMDSIVMNPSTSSSDFYSFYQKKLRALGWQEYIQASASEPGNSQTEYQKGDKHFVYGKEPLIDNTRGIIGYKFFIEYSK